MNCDRYEELISAGIDGELTDTEERDLRLHLDECPACREKSAAIDEQDRILASSRSVKQPAELRSKVRRRLGIQQRSVPRIIGPFPHQREVLARKDSEERPPHRMTGPWGRA